MKHSKRAAIFAEVLKYINNDDWERHGEFLVFGKEAFERYNQWPLEEASWLEDEVREFVSKAMVNRGQRSVKKRTTVDILPLDSKDETIREFTEALRAKFLSLPETYRKKFVKGLSANSGSAQAPTGPEPQAPSEVDVRDAALALEAIDWLNSAAARINSLDETEVSRELVHNAELFEEAHRCNLAGFKIATAVLCRAVLESALIQSTDPKRKIKNGRKADESYILLMLDAAFEDNILDDERRQAGKEIKKAGDAAIHKLQDFLGYAGRMNHIVDNTRKVVADLYASLERENR